MDGCMDVWMYGWMDVWMDGWNQGFTAGEKGGKGGGGVLLTMWISAFNVRQLHTQVLAPACALGKYIYVASLQEMDVVSGQAGRLHCMLCIVQVCMEVEARSDLCSAAVQCNLLMDSFLPAAARENMPITKSIRCHCTGIQWSGNGDAYISIQLVAASMTPQK